MKKQELLDIILELPANRRKQLAEEIYQNPDTADPDLNCGSQPPDAKIKSLPTSHSQRGKIP